MKLTRLLFLVCLLVFVLVGSNAFAAKAGKSVLKHSPQRSSAAEMCEWFDIYCGGVWTDECCGTVNGCLVSCVDTCGGPCIYEE